MSFAAAPPLIAAGPVGWAVLGVLTVATVGVIVLNAVEQAHKDHSDSPPSPEQPCPQQPITPEELADEGTPHPTNPVTGTGTRQVVKPGGMGQADKDFDRMGPQNQRLYPNGTRVGTLPDGRTANVRPTSSSGDPTVEIEGAPGKPPIKIRYPP